MEQSPPLDDLALFVDVAETGGLAGAARRTGATVPTLSRKMAALERQLGRKLFERGPRGYALTTEGRALLDQLDDLRAVRARLTRVLSNPEAVRVRLTAGSLTAGFIARRLATVWSQKDPWRLEFVEGSKMLDIARRDADIGVRNRRPDQPWLAGRRTRKVEFAEFASSEQVTGYVTFRQGPDPTASTRWIHANHADEILTTASSPFTLMHLAQAGVGRIVVSTTAALDMPGLHQVSPVIEELTNDEWLVCHHEARHDPPIRAALDAVAKILTARN
ncbi:LysR family transcriptional regulator [Shimia sp.]|uniref:LysR family transcriptional regulator n=1 Tax=Shimia sp. TaxID=1954381 RepID=UPI003B8AF49F